MKSSILNAVLASVAVVAPVFGAPEKSEETAPKYKNRLSVSPNSIGYERTAEDSLFVSFEHSVSPAFLAKNVDTDVSTTAFKIGQNFAVDARSRVIPSIGVSMFKDMGTATLYAEVRGEKGVSIQREIEVKNAFIFHGTLGLHAEYDLFKSTTVGLGLHGMMGQAWGSELHGFKHMSYGFNASLPVTFRLGTDAHWDVRMEPFAYLLKDYANYVGGKATLGYRF